MKNVSLFTAVGTVVVAVLAMVSVYSWLQSTTPAPANTLVGAQPASTADKPAKLAPVPVVVETQATAPSQGNAIDSAQTPAEQSFDANLALDDLVALTQSGSDDAWQKATEAQNHLLALAGQDPRIREQLIQRVLANPTSEAGRLALDTLSQLNGSDVVELGLSLVDSPRRPDVVAGLTLLTEMGASAPGILDAGERLMDEYADDSEVIVNTLSAMQFTPPAPEKAATLASKAAAFTFAADPGMRSASLFAVGDWATSDELLEPVTTALQSNETDDRISAAMALANSRIASPQLRDTFLQRIEDTNELWEIRRIAADALQQRFELDSQHSAVLLAFRDEQDRVAKGQ